jgi:hypothetical protein
VTDIEQRLIEAAKRGDELECTEPDNVVRAELIRELLIGRHGELDPRGVMLTGARIEGVLDLDRVKAVVGLFLDDCTFDEPIEARNASLPDLMVHGGRCAGISADGIQVSGDLFLRDGARIVGVIRLVGAHIAGNLELGGVEITNTAGPALDLNGIQVDGNVFLRQGVQITGNGGDGAVDLVCARIGKDLEFTDSEITNDTGSAVRADRVRVDGALFLFGQAAFSGGDDTPAISLYGAHVGGAFNCGRAVGLKVGASPALDLRGAIVEASVTLPTSFTCPDQGRGRRCSNERWVVLDELTYASLGSRWGWESWLHLIRRHTPAYHASAYQRLAAVERAAGHDGTVRRILMAQQTDLRRRSPESLGGPMTRWFHWLWGLLAGYGYRARRTAAALLLVLTIVGALGWWAGQVPTRPGHHAAERVAGMTATAGTPCSTVELIGLGLDRGLPLATTGMRTKCDLDTTTRRGGAFTWAIWAVQFLIWGLATLALAGYTNLVRKPG